MGQQSGPSVFAIGRIVSWLMVVLMLVAIGYALTMTIINWSVIRV